MADVAGVVRSPTSAVFSSPAILHFTNAGFTSFMSKYKRIAKAGSSMDQSPFMLHMVSMVKKVREARACSRLSCVARYNVAAAAAAAVRRR